MTLIRSEQSIKQHIENTFLFYCVCTIVFQGAETITEGSYKKGFCPERKRLEQMAFKRCLREFNLLPQGAQQQVLVRSIAAWRQAVPFTEVVPTNAHIYIS